MKTKASFAGSLTLLALTRAASAQSSPPEASPTPSAAPVTTTTVPPAPVPVVMPLRPAEPDVAPVVPSSEDVAQLASLDALVVQLEEPAKHYRLVGGLTALALGAGTIPLSVAMISRGSSTEAGPVILLGVGIGEVIGGTIVLVTPGASASGYRALGARIAEGRQGGEAPALTLASAEHLWQEQAQLARLGRHVSGTFSLLLGLVATGFGVALDAATPFGGFSRSDQDGVSVAAFGIGYAGIIGAVHAFVFPTPIEVGWQAYQRGHASSTPTPLKVTLGGLRPLAVPNGMAMGWGAAF